MKGIIERMKDKCIVDVAGGTHVGNVRTNNQDFFYTPTDEDKLQVAIVADGMGGYKGGDVASKLCTNTSIQYINNKYTKRRNIPNLLVDSAKVANTAVYDHAQENEYLRGMGTTVVMAAFDDDIVHILNVGDSRAYHILSDNTVEQISVDHTLVQEYYSMGKITQQQAKHHMYRHVITRAIGTDQNIQCDTFSIPFKQGEHILLCSDGMYEYIDNDMIAQVMKASTTGKQAIDTMINISNKAGGADNITVVIASKKKAQQ